MPLDEYRRKRDFTKSPEPRGDGPARRRGKAPMFCVQKHLATQLHYDFRLEHNGVLLSWAVPKGPSLDPSVKRLAMHVEDHPVEYGSFEGVIPEGYGAGVVMLWDSGTWTPEVDDVDAALAKGDLKFTLDGYKLKGSWVLVRTRGYNRKGASREDDGRSWLLIKHRDEWSGDLDITTFAPLSVKSELDLPEILAADAPDIWNSGKPASHASLAHLRKIVEQAVAIKAAREEVQTAETGNEPSRKRSTKKATPASKRKASAGVKKAAKKAVRTPPARRRPAKADQT
jgi:bifunctional non-homologous end joining protein LigD